MIIFGLYFYFFYFDPDPYKSLIISVYWSAMFLLPGLLIAAAGVVTNYWKTLPLAAVQGVLASVLTAYYVFAFAID
ncbi:MAG: hypothetical protein AAF662_12200 [Pseudomonadota bacterium]